MLSKTCNVLRPRAPVQFARPALDARREILAVPYTEQLRALAARPGLTAQLPTDWTELNGTVSAPISSWMPLL